MQNEQQAIGIVAEYNPFHNGHAWQLAQVRTAFPNALIVAVMSGNFVQRGEPAILDKWSRAQIAIENGVDLVIELPFSFACRSAEHFARGSIGLLNALGIIDGLFFGAECHSLDELLALARASLNQTTISTLKKYMKAGMSYPQALQLSLSGSSINEQTINNPNNILAVEYLKQLITLNSSIKPHLVVRHIAGYKEPNINSSIASATAIRRQLSDNGLTKALAMAVPEFTLSALEAGLSNHALIHEDNPALSLLSLYKLRNSSPEYLQKYTDVSEGLEYKIIKNACQHDNLTQLTSSLVNKRYPQSKIKRILLQALVGMHKAEQPTYIRPLAFNNNGRAALTKIKAKSSLPLITKLGKDFANLPQELRHCQVLASEIAAGNVYQLLFAKPRVHQVDYLHSPLYINI